MAHGTVRAAATACLGLIALQAASSRGGAGRLSALLGDVNRVVQRALDPSVPAIPDLRNGGSWGAPTITVGQGAAAAATWRPVHLSPQ